jgi:hypothetical protein
VKGFKSKAGKPFDAAIEWREGKVQFAFAPREADGGPGRGPPGGEGEGGEPRGATAGGGAGAPKRTAKADTRVAEPAKAAAKGGKVSAKLGKMAPAVGPGAGGVPRGGGGGGMLRESQLPASPVGLPCPACGEGRTVRGRAAWGCDRWRDGCRFVLPFEHGGVTMSEAEAAARIVGR